MEAKEILRSTIDIRIVRAIDRGGMGQVFEGRAILAKGLTMPVAVKVLNGDTCDSPMHRELLLREAKIALELSHDHCNLVTVFYVTHTKDSAPCMVMELVAGMSAIKLVHQTPARRLTAPIVRRIAGALIDAVTYLHDKEVIHRDISASNVLIRTDGAVKLADLALVKRLAESHSGLYRGTPAYSSPEALRNEPISPAADMFSVGVVLFQLVTGTLPFGKERTARLTSDPLLIIPDELPDDLRELLHGLLVPEPGERMTARQAREFLDHSDEPVASADELADELLKHEDTSQGERVPDVTLSPLTTVRKLRAAPDPWPGPDAEQLYQWFQPDDVSVSSDEWNGRRGHAESRESRLWRWFPWTAAALATMVALVLATRAGEAIERTQELTTASEHQRPERPSSMVNSRPDDTTPDAPSPGQLAGTPSRDDTALPVASDQPADQPATPRPSVTTGQRVSHVRVPPPPPQSDNETATRDELIRPPLAPPSMRFSYPSAETE